MFGNSKFRVGVLKHPGYNGKGSDSPPPPTNQTVTQTNLPEYARPYFENLLNRTQAQSYQNYQPYGGQRIAGFTPEQQQIQAQFSTMREPGQFNQATQGFNLAGGMGMNAANQGLNQALSYRPGTINAPSVYAPGLNQYGMSGAQSSYNPNLTAYQMAGPQNVSAQNVGTERFGQGAADYYSNPYLQNVTNTALREARLQGDIARQQGALGSIGRGTFGGARQALLQAEQRRGLNQQIGDIQNRGAAEAYTNAQAQFQADQARSLQAQQANQGAGLQAMLANQQAEQNARQQNLQAQLGVQQLGTQTGTQMALANLTNEQQARVQNLASQLQTQGLGADQALKAALANQSTNMQAQQMTQQGQQYAANLGQQLYGTGMQNVLGSASGLGSLGTTQQAADLQRLNAQQASAAQNQALSQTQMDTAYQDFLRQRDYPQEQLGFYSNILRGLPVQLASTQQSYAAPPNMASQIAGAGLGALSLGKLLGS
jgi:hypothetical protein